LSATVAAAQVSEKPLRIAVLDFTNASTDPQMSPLGKGLQAMTTADLSQVQALKIVERERLTELLKEIDFSQTKMVEASTAVRIGNLSGATHVVGGAFTVVDEKMRIDTRLVAVESGEVVAAWSSQGNRDEFFDLQKEVSKKMIASLGLTLSPKERVQVGRVHTADFDAFASFGRGIDAFDHERHQEALALVRKAASLDADFTLAKVTLERYEQIIAAILVKRDALAAAALDAEFGSKREAAGHAVEVFKQLIESAVSRDSSEVGARRRLAALYLLCLQKTSVNRDLANVEDRFLLRQIAQRMGRLYLNESRRLFPAFHLVPVWNNSFSWPRDAESARRGGHRLVSHEEFLDKTLEKMQWDLGHDPGPGYYVFEYAQEDLRLNYRDALGFVDSVFDQYTQHFGKNEQYRKWLDREREKHARRLRKVLDLDRSTAVFAGLAASTKDTSRLSTIAKEIEINRALAGLLEGARNKDALAEYLRNSIEDDGRQPTSLDQWFGWVNRSGIASGMPPTAAAMLTASRKIHNTHCYRFDIAGHRIWDLSERWCCYTGPQTVPYSSPVLRYFADATVDDPALILLDGDRARTMSLVISLSYRRSDGFFPNPAWHDTREDHVQKRLSKIEEAITKGPPEVGLLFGVRNVECTDPRKHLQGTIAAVSSDSFTLASVQRQQHTKEQLDSFIREHGHRPPNFRVNPLASEERGKGKVDLLEVTVGAGEVSIRTDTGSASFPCTTEKGFFGLYIRGAGFVEIGEVRVEVNDGE